MHPSQMTFITVFHQSLSYAQSLLTPTGYVAGILFISSLHYALLQARTKMHIPPMYYKATMLQQLK